MNTFKCKLEFIHVIEFLTLWCTHLFFKGNFCPNFEEKIAMPLDLNPWCEECALELDNSEEIQPWNISSRNLLFLHMCSIFSPKVYVAL